MDVRGQIYEQWAKQEEVIGARANCTSLTAKAKEAYESLPEEYLLRQQRLNSISRSNQKMVMQVNDDIGPTKSA
jgi:hypothetical protein